MNLFKQHIVVKPFVYRVCMLFLFTAKLQAQIVINGGGIVNINGGASGALAYLVLNSGATTPVTFTASATNGGIMMETEFNVTRWIAGTTGTSINLPYYSNNSGTGYQFPLAVSNMSGAVGTATAALQFSSVNAVQTGGLTTATGWDNASYKPVGVANMNGWNGSIATTDNSADVIDRFWVIDQFGYTTVPTCTLTFGYINAEAAVNGSNEAGLAALLRAEPYMAGIGWANSPTGGGVYPTGTDVTSTNTGSVIGVPVPTNSLGTAVYRTWTLVDKSNPLPVDLLSFSGTCYGNINANLVWSTATEINSSYFTVEKSTDGQNFTWLANINAVGNSTHTQRYSYVDVSDIGNITYYRLSETDLNGSKKVFSIIPVTGCDDNIKENINAYSGAGGVINLNMYSLSNQPLHVTVYDITGRLIYATDFNAIQGENSFTMNPSVAIGVYVVEAETNLTSLVKRVPVIE